MQCEVISESLSPSLPLEKILGTGEDFQSKTQSIRNAVAVAFVGPFDNTTLVNLKWFYDGFVGLVFIHGSGLFVLYGRHI